MIKNKRINKVLVLSFTIASLLTTSFGGAFASSALAADVTATQEKKSDSNQGIIAGIVALGLLTMLGKGHGGSSADSAKTTTSKTSTSGSTSGQTNSSTSTTSATSSSSLKSDEARAVQLMNADRTKNGLPALQVDSRLTALAERYAQDMINRGYFSHTNPEGQSPFDRMQAAGIGYSYAGENLAINNGVDAAEVAFMNSSGHRANILSSNYTKVGIGVRYSPSGQAYVVQEFIKP